MRKSPPKKMHRTVYSLLNILFLSSSIHVARAALPQVDFDRMGAVGLGGTFAGFDFYNSSSSSFDPATSSLLARAADGSLTKLGSTNSGGSIFAGCNLDGKFYFGGSFSSVEGVTASNVAVFDPSKNSFSALNGGGLDGAVRSMYCEIAKGTVWVAGEFKGPSGGATGYGGSVVRYTPKGDSWSTAPFGGLNGPVFTIAPSPSGSSLFFGGSFRTVFSGGNVTTNVTGVSNPNVPSSSGATAFSSSLVPIPLGSADIEAAPSSPRSEFSKIENVLCPSGADGPGNTWLARDNSQPFITVRTFSFLTASGIRLGNTFVDGRGTTAFTVTTIPENNVLRLNYTNPSNGETKTCETDCPLIHDPSVPYQDFLIMGNSNTMTGVQIALTRWTGAGPGLHYLQILSDGAFASSVQSQNGASCFAPGASGTSESGPWRTVSVTTIIPATGVQVKQANVSVGTSPSQAPTFTWTPYVSAAGNYQVNLFIPGCIQMQDCAARTSVKIVVSPGSGLPPTSITVNQRVDQDSSVSIYNGPIVPASPDFTARVELALADQPTGNGMGGQYRLIADRIQLKLLSTLSGGASGSGNVSTPGTSQTGFGLFEWTLSKTDTFNATGVIPNTTITPNDQIAFQLAAVLGSSAGSSIRAIAVHPNGNVYLGGVFTLSSGPSNIVAFKNGNLTALNEGGLNGPVNALTLYGNKLFIGGSFRDTTSGSGQGALRGVASYDTSNDQWSALKTGLDGAVTSLNIAGGQILVTGNFSTIPSSIGSSAGHQAGGLAAWNVGDGSWHQSGGFITGRLSFVGNGTADAGYLAGNVEAAVKFGSDGFVSLANGDDKGPKVTTLKVQFDSNSQASTPSLQARWNEFKNLFARQSANNLPPPIRAPAPSILTGAFYGEGDKQVSIVAGNFTFTSSSATARNIALYHASNDAMEALKGPQVNGTVYTVLVVKDKLYVGGQFGLENSAQGGNGFAIYDLKKGEWDSSSVQGLQGSPVIVRSITTTPFKDNIVYVAGSFTGAGSSASCAGICALDINSGQWSPLANGVQGEVAVVDYAASDLSLLIAGGAVSPNGQASKVAMYSIANSTWTTFGDQSSLPGPVTALAVNNANVSSIFVSGSSGNSAPFISFWNGAAWSSVGSPNLGAGSTVQQLTIVPLQEDHGVNAMIEKDRMLMISGNLQSSSFGNASSALFDGESFIPYISTKTTSGGLGTVAALFRSLSSFSFSRRRFLATGVVILISIAIAAGIVFLLALIGIVWTLLARRGEKEGGKFYPVEDDDSMRGSGRGPSSLLEHINAATRTTILGAGAASPFDSMAVRKQASPENSGMSHDNDPFAANTQDTHQGVGTAVSTEEDVPRQTHVRYSFDGAGEGELQLAQGMQVEVLDSHDPAWWYVRDGNGREGVVPASYLY